MTIDQEQAPMRRIRLSSFKELDIKRKFAAGAGATGIFVLGFAAENGLSTALETIFPDQNAIRAMQIQENLDAKTTSIENLTRSIQAKLEEAGGDEAFQNETAQLLAAINELKPDIAAAAQLNTETASRLVSAKAGQLSRAGFSTISDFELAVDQSVTICQNGFVFGFGDSYTTTSIRARISGFGETVESRLEPGDRIEMIGESGGVVSVTYRGQVDEEVNIHGFDVNCS